MNIMPLDLGIKLIFSFPSILFFITFSFKTFIEKHHFKKITEPQVLPDLINDFILLLGIESAFILIINSLIIIIELHQNEIGIILLLISILFSYFLVLGSHLRHVNLISFGFVGLFFIIGWELSYFLFYDLEIIRIFGIEIKTVTGLLSLLIGFLIYRNFLHYELTSFEENMMILKDSSRRLNSLAELKKSNRLTYEKINELIISVESDIRMDKYKKHILLLQHELLIYELSKSTIEINKIMGGLK